MVRLLSSLIASLLLTSASAVSAQSTCHNTRSCSVSQGGLWPGEFLYSVFTTSLLSTQFLTNGNVVAESFGIPFWQSNTKGLSTNRLRIRTDGRVEVAMVVGSMVHSVRIVSTYSPGSVLGNYRMQPGLLTPFTIIAENGFPLITDSPIFGGVGSVAWVIRGNNLPKVNDAVSIYLPDSGYDTTYDNRGGPANWHSGVAPPANFVPPMRPNLFQSFSSDPNYHDLIRHGTQEAMLIAADPLGTAPNTTVHVIKITNGTSSRVREPDVVRSIRAAFTHVTGKPKVINLSLSFGCDWPQTIKCAMQWAYRAGIVVVAAAGNGNTNCRERLQYAFVVGAVHVPRTDTFDGIKSLITSNYGAMVDAWSLGTIQDPFRTGSSYATALVTGAAAQAFLAIAPARRTARAVFSYLKHHGGPRMVAADQKLDFSTFSNRQIIYTQRNSTVIPDTWVATAEFCTTITGAGLPTANPIATHWNTLIVRAYASNRNGSLVTDSTYDVNARITDLPITP